MVISRNVLVISSNMVVMSGHVGVSGNVMVNGNVDNLPCTKILKYTMIINSIYKTLLFHWSHEYIYL